MRALRDAVPGVTHPPLITERCTGDYAQTFAHWDLDQDLEGWRRFAASHCVVLPAGMNCRGIRYVVAPGASVAFTLPVSVSLPVAMELFAAMRALYPEHELTGIEYPTAEAMPPIPDSAEYRVRMLAPPDFSAGQIVTLRRTCSVRCWWAQPDPVLAEPWRPTATDRHLRRQRRSMLTLPSVAATTR